MRNDKPSLIRPVTLREGASRPVVTPLSPSVVYASETPDALDAQYDGARLVIPMPAKGIPTPMSWRA